MAAELGHYVIFRDFIKEVREGGCTCPDDVITLNCSCNPACCTCMTYVRKCPVHSRTQDAVDLQISQSSKLRKLPQLPQITKADKRDAQIKKLQREIMSLKRENSVLRMLNFNQTDVIGKLHLEAYSTICTLRTALYSQNSSSPPDRKRALRVTPTDSEAPTPKRLHKS